MPVSIIEGSFQDNPQTRSDILVFELTAPTEVRDAQVRVVGNFNNWKIDKSSWVMKHQPGGSYIFSIQKTKNLPDILEYRYVKNNYSGSETQEHLLSPINRLPLLKGDQKVKESVLKWFPENDYFNPGYLPHIEIISENFEIPQLIKTRRIAAILPYDYHTTQKRYPVLYLQDGQNLFDDYAPFGNWAVDKKLSVMAETGLNDLIIVAIDHGYDQRISEFTPTHVTKLGVGDGKKYARFLADTLKPYIDRKFRTLPDRLNTGIGGSSMGGLVSIYAAFLYPEVYSKMMIFSPSLWVDPDILKKMAGFYEKSPVKLYFYAGGAEGASLLAHANRFVRSIEVHKKEGWPVDLKISINPEGKHNEATWGQEFPEAVKWLYFDGK